MKSYTITVNGNVYEVTVEENVGGAAPTQRTTAAPKPKAAVATQKASAPTGAAGTVKVTAPMPGKIIAAKVNVGQTVKKGEVVIILEAMKMENEIVAPQDGTVVTVDVSAGSAVEAGDVLVTMN